MKGAIEKVLKACSRMYWDGDIVPLPADFAATADKAMESMTRRGQRVMACAFRPDFVFKASQDTLVRFSCLLLCALLFMFPVTYSARKWTKIWLGILLLSHNVLSWLCGVPLSDMLVCSVAVQSFAMQRMAQRHAIVRRVDVLETLGRVTDICSDKTGTLTQAHMAAVNIWQPQSQYEVTGAAFSDLGQFVQDGKHIHVLDKSAETFLECCAICNGAKVYQRGGAPPMDTPMVGPSPYGTSPAGPATVSPSSPAAGSPPETASPDGGMGSPRAGVETASGWVAQGSPTEVALAFLALKYGWTKFSVMATNSVKKSSEFPFDSTTKSMTVVVKETVRVVW